MAEKNGLKDLPFFPKEVVEAIRLGELDPYLEIILSVAHNRKRALRQVPGF